MKSKLLFPLFLISSLNTFICFSQNLHQTGLVFSDSLYKKIETISPALRFSDAEVIRYSLKQYCPEAGNQGSIGSCTSWASGYAAYTISEAIQQKNTDKVAITKAAKSALFIYNQIKISDCNNGAYIESALQLLKNKGDCSFFEFNPNDCRVLPDGQLNMKAQENKIKEYNSLFPLFCSSQNKITATINSLLSNKPVVIGLNIQMSFENNIRNGKYTPTDNAKIIGGHALCVIGFDNETKEFEILNSWGKSWGNNGFFKMSYEDYAKYCNTAFQFTLNKNKLTDNGIINGNFELFKYIGKSNETNKNNFVIKSPTYKNDGYYYFPNQISKDDFFRIKATNLKKDSYVYIISFKPDKSYEILFPHNYVGTSNIECTPFISYENASIELPVDPENGFFAETKGDDVLCILYSDNRILNLDKLVLNQNKFGGDIWGWLKESFQSNLLTSKDLSYNTNKMGVKAENATGKIIPIILKINVQ